MSPFSWDGQQEQEREKERERTQVSQTGVQGFANTLHKAGGHMEA